MSVTANDLQNLIITSLANADPTALSGLQTNIPKYWLLWARQGVLLELQYWYTRREGIRYLMACLNQQTDYARSASAASRNSSNRSRSDMVSDASSSGVSSSVSNRSSSSQASDETNASSSSSGNMNRHSVQTMSASSSQSDTGSGSNSSSQTSTMSSASTQNANSSDSSSSERRQAREVTGFHQRRNYSTKISAGLDLGLGIAETLSKTGEKETGTIQDSMTGQGQSLSTQSQIDTSTNDSAQDSAQSSSSSYQANAVSTSTMSSSGSSVMSSLSASSASMSGAGSSTSVSAGSSSSSSVSSSTRTATGSGESHSLSVAASTTTSTMESLHQRFLHLKELWTKANEMIAWYEKQRLNLPAYTLQAIVIQYPDGLNADAANRYLVSTPFGKGLGT